METAILKEPMQSEWYLQVPYSFFDRKLKPTARTMLSAVRSLTTTERAPQISYSTFSKKLHISTATVARNVKSLKEQGEIEQDKSLRTAATYTYKGEDPRKGFFVVEAFLFGREFNRRIFDKKAKIEYEVRHRLTDAEVYVLSLIDSYKEYEGSQASIASRLKYSEKTVSRSIKALIECRLIVGYKKGKSKKERGKFVSNKELIAKLRSKFRKAKKENKNTKESAQIKAINAKIDAERAESERLEKLRVLEERLSTYLLKDPKYAAVKVEYDAKMKEYRKAYMAGDYVTVEALESITNRLEATMDDIKARVVSTGEYLNSGQT